MCCSFKILHWNVYHVAGGKELWAFKLMTREQSLPELFSFIFWRILMRTGKMRANTKTSSFTELLLCLLVLTSANSELFQPPKLLPILCALCQRVCMGRHHITEQKWKSFTECKAQDEDLWETMCLVKGERNEDSYLSKIHGEFKLLLSECASYTMVRRNHLKVISNSSFQEDSQTGGQEADVIPKNSLNFLFAVRMSAPTRPFHLWAV